MTRLIILLIGLPGSGKSFLARRMAANFPGTRVISTDCIRAQLFGDESIQGPWQLVWQQVQAQLAQAVEQIRQHKAPLAIYDATNAARRQRRQAIALARETGFTQITGLWVDTPLALCMERNQRRDRRVPEEVIYKMHRRLQGAPPACDEGFNQLIRYRLARGTVIALT